MEYIDRENSDIGKLYKGSFAKKNFEEEYELLKKIDNIDPDSEFTVKLKGALILKQSKILQETLASKTCNTENSIINLKPKYYEIILADAGYDLSKNNFYINFNEFLHAFKNLVKGMIKLQENNLVHRDIKPINVLIIDKPIIKLNLIDFGLMCNMDDVFNKNNDNSIERLKHSFIYKYYPPEFAIAFIFLQYNYDKLFNNYLEQLKKMKKDDNFINNVKKLYDDITQKINTGSTFENIFNIEMAKKTDIYALSYIINSLKELIPIYDRKNLDIKNFINQLYDRCHDPNPYSRISINELYQLLEQKINLIK